MILTRSPAKMRSANEKQPDQHHALDRLPIVALDERADDCSLCSLFLESRAVNAGVSRTNPLLDWIT